jgi:UDP-GlcNAc:undecaprenyl-phosphate GlcNAc-1-phosphate transferase
VREYLFVALVAAIITYAFVPLMRRLAIALGAFTPVRDRDVHTQVVPRLGGVGMLLGFAAAAVVASRLPFLQQVFRTDEIWGVLIGGALVCLLGAWDDVRELDALTKLGGQLIAAAIMAFSGVQLWSLPLGETTVLPAPVLVAITVVVVLFSTNAVNFIDGLDGLAAGVVGIAALSFFAYSYLIAQSYSPANVFTSAAFISAALGGCCLGFLPHNVFPARIFMGDSGALFLGLLIAAASIQITGTVTGSDVSTNAVAATIMPLIVPVAILLLPAVDLLWAIIRRTAAGRNPWTPDAGHLHHRMLQIGHGHRRAVLLLWLWAAVASLGSVAFVFFDPRIAGAALAVGLLVAVGLTAFLPRVTVGRHKPIEVPDRP